MAIPSKRSAKMLEQMSDSPESSWCSVIEDVNCELLDTDFIDKVTNDVLHSVEAMLEAGRDFGEAESWEIGSEDVVAAGSGDVRDQVTELDGGSGKSVKEEDGGFRGIASFAVEDVDA